MEAEEEEEEERRKAASAAEAAAATSAGFAPPPPPSPLPPPPVALRDTAASAHSLASPGPPAAVGAVAVALAAVEGLFGEGEEERRSRPDAHSPRAPSAAPRALLEGGRRGGAAAAAVSPPPLLVNSFRSSTQSCRSSALRRAEARESARARRLFFFVFGFLVEEVEILSLMQVFRNCRFTPSFSLYLCSITLKTRLVKGARVVRRRDATEAGGDVGSRRWEWAGRRHFAALVIFERGLFFFSRLL